MPLYRPSELHQFLKTLQTSPNKRLSQNFLIDGNVVQKIIQAAGIQNGDLVLEIGSGPGVLTEALGQAKAQVIAIEKDGIFAKALKRFDNVTIYHSDIKDFPFHTLKNHMTSSSKMKVVANLPYHLTSPILGLLLPRYDLFSKVTVMVQDEVAQRIIASSGSKDYSALSIFVKIYSEAFYEFFVGRNCFYPKPKVDSAVVSFLLHPPPIENIETFIKFVRLLFCHRRKMLRSILSPGYEKLKIDSVFSSLCISHKSRPENLSLQQLLNIYKILN